MKIIILFALVAFLPAQQSNSKSASLWLTNFATLIQPPNNVIPGPYSCNVTMMISDVINLSGYDGQSWSLYADLNPPCTGILTLPVNGIVDICYPTMSLVAQGTLPGTFLPVCSINPSICVTYTASLPINYPSTPFNLSLQAIFTNPLSPAGYTLTACVWAWQ